MPQLIIFILGLIVGGVAAWFLMGRRRRPQAAKENPSEGLIERQAKEKEENRRKLIEFFKSAQKVSNNDVERLLNVSDATATRYLDELEKEGHIRQVGKTGRHVYYKRT